MRWLLAFLLCLEAAQAFAPAPPHLDRQRGAAVGRRRAGYIRRPIVAHMAAARPSGDPVIEGLLFDCDGTLVNSMPVWACNWVETCAEFGLDLDEARFYQLAGMTVEETLQQLCTEQGVQVDAEAFFARKDELAADAVKRVTEIYPVAQIAREAHGKFKMGVVSSGPRSMVEQFLEQTNLRHLFEVLVCAEDVTHHKPHPEPFLVAAERLNVQPSACRAYEDADAGIESVHRAGMSAVDVRRLPGHPLFVPPASPAQV